MIQFCEFYSISRKKSLSVVDRYFQTVDERACRVSLSDEKGTVNFNNPKKTRELDLVFNRLLSKSMLILG